MINSENPTADVDIMAAIKGIRQATRDSDAKDVFAKPVLIVALPQSESLMTRSVRPKYDRNKVGVELAGPRLTEQERDLWRKTCLEDNVKKFRDPLVKHIALLAPLRGWMRMRVHFGHVKYAKVHSSFLNMESEYSFRDFAEMVEESGSRITFDRK